MFTQGFSGTVYQDETITCEVDGFTVTATIHSDDDQDAPWDREDGHGPVSDWRSHGYNGYAAKEPGERPLNRDRTSTRFYDFAAAVEMARREGWGAPAGTFREGVTPTAGMIAHAAATADFNRLKAWCDDQWQYVGVSVTVARNGIQLVREYEHAVWGIESDAAEYLTETANELLSEALQSARDAVATLCA